jgi:hypothetical protein
MTASAIRTLALGLVLTTPTFAALAEPFTWNLSNASPALAGTEITADTFTTDDYLVNFAYPPPATEGSDQFIMRINGFSLKRRTGSAPWSEQRIRPLS